ncbi:MAG: hypothetical protein ACQETH_09620 [Candidatus Rifleibacteriota bacterium]
MKRLRYLIPVIILLMITAHSALFAVDTGKVFAGKCRDNLKYLNDAVQKFVNENDTSLPAWSTYENVKTMLLGLEYLPRDPVPPTKDCKYFLVSNSRDDFQWYCALHGVLDGDKTISFHYHEHRTVAKTSSRYMKIEKYKDHTKDLLRWTNYYPTPMERLKYQYNKNPLTTVIIVVFAVLVLFFIYRNLFA